MRRTSSIDVSTQYFNPRLRNSFAVIRRRPMAVFEAPIGYGKTIAVREFLRESGLSAIWTTALDAGPHIFWRDFCRNLEQAVPHKKTPIAALRRLGYPNDPVKTGEACHLFMNLELDDKSALVVDDFHLHF